MMTASQTDPMIPVRRGRGQAADRIVADALRELLKRFEGARVPTPGGPAPEHWEDEDYLYVEMPLPRGATTEIDVNVQDGKAFIRIGVPPSARAHAPAPAKRKRSVNCVTSD